MKTRHIVLSITAVLIACLTVTAYSFAQEIPKPGTVIDKNNYKKYAHLFPPEILPAFEDGFGGLVTPASIPVGETKLYHFHKAFLALSAVNKGKYSLDASGNVVGGWNRNGMPFPDLQRSDKDFLVKLMWNYAGRYTLDDHSFYPNNFSLMQRKGEPVRLMGGDLKALYFTGRIEIPPTPIMKTSSNLSNALFWHFKEPEGVKNMMTLSYRYMDPNKADETYIYLPNLRRVLRGDSGQRAVPMTGSILALDDISLFDGKTNEFTYKLVGEQKILALTDATSKNVTKAELGLKKLPVAFRGKLTPVDVYVIDIIAKDSVYPQSRKRIYLNKDNLTAYYAIAWDRAGKLWKIFTYASNPFLIPGDDPVQADSEAFSIDLQFGMSNLIAFKRGYNKGGLSYEDFTPAAMVKAAR